MKKIFIYFLLLLYSSVSFAAPEIDSLRDELNHAIKDAPSYDNKKLEEIAQLKRIKENLPSDFSTQYNNYLPLFEAYKYYNYDSALAYAKKLQMTAEYAGNPSLLIDSKLKVVSIMLSGGMFKETFDSLRVISIKDVDAGLKAEYYRLTGLSYFNLADFDNDNVHSPDYNKKASLYLDSALALYASNSFEHLYYSSLKFLKKGYPDSALARLNTILTRRDLSYHQVALAASTLGGILMNGGHDSQAKPYLIQAAIADIKSSTKETLALLYLAGIVYKEGNIEEAVRYIEKANSDASFFNTRLRKVQIGAILPLIEGGMVTTINTQKGKLQFFLVLLSIFALLLAAFAIIIFTQVKKLKVAKASLSDANVKLQQINIELIAANQLKEKYNSQLQEINNQLLEANKIKEEYNGQLQHINHRLSEANKIKEEYIGYYFSIDNEFLAKIEKLITSIDKKLMERKWEEIKFLIKSVDPKKEKNELLNNFDKVFLRLFPNFVAQFNTLFGEEDKIILKDDQLLNAELRIFALIRLGITDNDKIAEILGYSINTIYAKKTKIRSKTIVDKDEFEKRIAEITTLTH
jgi:hypothetical protein